MKIYNVSSTEYFLAAIGSDIITTLSIIYSNMFMYIPISFEDILLLEKSFM